MYAENSVCWRCVVVSRGLKLRAMLAYCANRSLEAGCSASGIMPDYRVVGSACACPLGDPWIERDPRAVSVGERGQTRSCSDGGLGF
jgi:hypothetical protein